MLWQSMSKIPVEMLARNLMDCNPDLHGGIKVTRVKKFRDTDSDIRGESMAGVRLVQVETTKEFRESLFFFLLDKETRTPRELE